MFAFGGILFGAGALMLIGTVVEMSTYGDKEDLNGKENSQALYEASKFRRLKQYEAVLLQRKTERAQNFLAFSIVRNGIQLGFFPRA